MQRRVQRQQGRHSSTSSSSGARSRPTSAAELHRPVLGQSSAGRSHPGSAAPIGADAARHLMNGVDHSLGKLPETDKRQQRRAIWCHASAAFRARSSVELASSEPDWLGHRRRLEIDRIAAKYGHTRHEVKEHFSRLHAERSMHQPLRRQQRPATAPSMRDTTATGSPQRSPGQVHTSGLRMQLGARSSPAAEDWFRLNSPSLMNLTSPWGSSDGGGGPELQDEDEDEDDEAVSALPATTVWVGGVPLELAAEPELREVFSSCGEVGSATALSLTIRFPQRHRMVRQNDSALCEGGYGDRRAPARCRFLGPDHLRFYVGGPACSRRQFPWCATWPAIFSRYIIS